MRNKRPNACSKAPFAHSFCLAERDSLQFPTLSCPSACRSASQVTAPERPGRCQATADSWSTASEPAITARATRRSSLLQNRGPNQWEGCLRMFEGPFLGFETGTWQKPRELDRHGCTGRPGVPFIGSLHPSHW